MNDKLTKFVIIMALAICFPAGCFIEEKGSTYRKKAAPLSVFIEIPSMQHTFTEGYPKELVARTSLDKGTIKGEDLIWTSDLDGVIGQGEIITTDILSIGDHVITLTAYDKNENEVTSQIQIKKVKRPRMPKIKKKIEKPIIYVDRIDGTTYIDNRDGTVLDKDSNLMWLVTDDGYDRPYVEAYNYCLDLKYAGYNDWRLPTLDELEEISNIDYQKLEPVLCAVFEAKNGSGYWTQTESDFSISSMSNIRYFAVVKFRWNQNRNAYVGETIVGVDELSPRYSRCVRAAR